jgi:hypothetical protein
MFISESEAPKSIGTTFRIITYVKELMYMGCSFNFNVHTVAHMFDAESPVTGIEFKLQVAQANLFPRARCDIRVREINLGSARCYSTFAPPPKVSE